MSKFLNHALIFNKAIGVKCRHALEYLWIPPLVFFIAVVDFQSCLTALGVKHLYVLQLCKLTARYEPKTPKYHWCFFWFHKITTCISPAHPHKHHLCYLSSFQIHATSGNRYKRRDDETEEEVTKVGVRSPDAWLHNKQKATASAVPVNRRLGRDQRIIEK